MQVSNVESFSSAERCGFKTGMVLILVHKIMFYFIPYDAQCINLRRCGPCCK